MNTEQLIARVRSILLTPKTEWPVIASEADTPAGLFTRYILILSAIPPVAGFLKHSLIGISAPFIGTVRIGIGAGLTAALVQYAFGLVAVYIVALIVNALAPTFGGQKDWMQALKTTAYAFTASWIASAFVIVPALGWLLALAGGVYAIYLLYLGLPATMRGPSDKAAGYTAVTVISTIVLSIVLGVVVNRISGITGMGGMDSSRSATLQINSGNGSTTIDANSTLGTLGAMAKSMQASSQKLQAAQQSGDPAAQNKAAGEVVPMRVQDAATQLLVLLEFVVGDRELVDEREVERVSLLGPVQTHQQDVLLPLDRHSCFVCRVSVRCCAHVVPSSLSVQRRRS